VFGTVECHLPPQQRLLVRNLCDLVLDLLVVLGVQLRESVDPLFEKVVLGEYQWIVDDFGHVAGLALDVADVNTLLVHKLDFVRVFKLNAAVDSIHCYVLVEFKIISSVQVVVDHFQPGLNRH